MEEKNMKFLKDSLFYIGFGERLHEQLEEAMQKGRPEFKLDTIIQHEPPANKKSDVESRDTMFFELNFKKEKNGDRYFFNSYQAKMISTGKPDRTQVFYIKKNKGVTTKEAYNLLSGRSVNKDLMNKAGEKYNAWVQLNFEEKDKQGNSKMKVFHEKYGYDPAKALNKLQLKAIPGGQTAEAIKSLKKGNLVPATFSNEGKEIKGYIAANPQSWSLRLFDENGQELSAPGKTEKEKDQSQDQKESTKKNSVEQKVKSVASGVRKVTKVTRKPRVRKEVMSQGKGMKV